LLSLGLPAVGLAQITVSRNVMVSQSNATRPHYEVQIASDPRDPARLIACSVVGPDSTDPNFWEPHTVVYMSSDSGKTWRSSLEVGPRLYTIDPTCTFGDDGTAYFLNFGGPSNYMTTTLPGSTFEMILYRSKDDGTTWVSAKLTPIVDRPFLTADTTNSKYKGRIYVNGAGMVREEDNSAPMISPTLFRSTDRGSSFASPLQLVTAASHYMIGSGNSTVLSDGTLVWVYGEYKTKPEGLITPESMPGRSNAWLKAVRSEDGGESSSSAVIVNDWSLRFYGNMNCMPNITADRTEGPFKDRVYVAWPDLHSGRGQILVAYSSDKGKSWSQPTVVNDDWPRETPGSGPDDYMPNIAVNNKGVIGVSWYDRRDSADNLGWRVRFAVSLDGGETFLPSVAAAEASQRVDPKAPMSLDVEEQAIAGSGMTRNPKMIESAIGITNFAFIGGDTAGLAVDSRGVFHPLWVDNRTGISQIWTSDVSVSGEAHKNGSVELENLDDITDEVALEFRHIRYDPSQKSVSAELNLRNNSSDSVSGRLLVRVLSVNSTIGPVEIANSDNKLLGSGAIWDFSDLLHGGNLQPGELAGPKQLRFRVVNPPQSFHIIVERLAVQFAKLHTKVLGIRKGST
jgi:hypothetical protein